MSPSAAEDLSLWPRTVTTDRDGRLTLRGFGPRTRVGLLVLDDRFARKFVMLAAAGTDPAKEPTQVLEPAQLIEGRATCADTGKPVAGVRTAVTSYHVGEGYMSSSTSDGDPTDAKGRFRLNPGTGRRFTVEVSAPPGQPYLGVKKDVSWPPGAA